MHYQRWKKTGDPVGLRPNLGNRKPRPAVVERTCRVCGVVGELSLFAGKANICKPCSNDYKEDWKRKNPAKVQASHDRQKAVRKRYELRRCASRNGQDPDFIEAYVLQHDGTCDCCGYRPSLEERRLHIDHDHETGKFRGLLCNNCNGGLGRFKDDVGKLWSAIQYLVRAGAEPPGDLADRQFCRKMREKTAIR